MGGENISDSSFCRRGPCFEFGMDLVPPCLEHGFRKKNNNPVNIILFELIIRMELCGVQMNYLRRLTCYYMPFFYLLFYILELQM